MRDRWRIRGATPDDATAIAAVHVRSWHDAYSGILSADELATRSVEDRVAQWTEAIDGDETQVSVAEVGDELVGFVATGPSKDEDATDTTGEVGAIYLVADAWGRGIGTKLMSVALDCLQRKGSTEATLWVLEANKRARRFYAAQGWIEDGGMKDCFGGVSAPALRYRLPLPSERSSDG